MSAMGAKADRQETQMKGSIEFILILWYPTDIAQSLEYR